MIIAYICVKNSDFTTRATASLAYYGPITTPNIWFCRLFFIFIIENFSFMPQEFFCCWDEKNFIFFQTRQNAKAFCHPERSRKSDAIADDVDLGLAKNKFAGAVFYIRYRAPMRTVSKTYLPSSVVGIYTRRAPKSNVVMSEYLYPIPKCNA